MRSAIARGPCRVDLAGGTLDIWPLARLFPGATTVSVAVDVPVEVRVFPATSGYQVCLGSGRFTGGAASELRRSPATALVGLVLEHLAMPPCTVEVDSASPVGAGLGGSSTVTLALLAACRCALGRRDDVDLVALARDLEAELMALPTGVQDHVSAMAGGVVAIEHLAGGWKVRPLEVSLDELTRRLLVVYSGRSHYSARSNWQVIRSCLDGGPAVRDALAGIASVARQMSGAVEAGNWRRIGRLMTEEWGFRRELGDGVSTPEVEALLAAAEELGAYGGKVCGAGGGGCVALLCPPDGRAAIAAGLVSLGGAVLPAPAVARGLWVEAADGAWAHADGHAGQRSAAPPR